jgi:hypothetical protein
MKVAVVRWPTSGSAAVQERRRFNGHELVGDVLAGVRFKDGSRSTTDRKVAA